MRFLATLVFLAACGGGSKKTAEPAPADDRASASAGCLKMMQRQRECTDVFIPALVGWRVELDVPAGVAAEDASDGRDALVAKANAEWAASNSDEQLTGLCAQILGSIPEDQLPAMTALGEQCIAAASCEAFTTCLEPAQRQRLQAQKAAEATESRD